MKSAVHHASLVRPVAIVATVLLFAACASPPSLSEQGARVRAVTREDAKACRFVRVVQYNQREVTTGKTTTVMKAIGETNIRNAVAGYGANAFVLIKEETDWFLGTMDYQAEAFTC